MRRYKLGEMRNALRNARVNASSDPYPASRAMRVTECAVRPSCHAARSSNKRRRIAAGVSSMTARKMRKNCVRLADARRASASLLPSSSSESRTTAESRSTSRCVLIRPAHDDCSGRPDMGPDNASRYFDLIVAAGPPSPGRVAVRPDEAVLPDGSLWANRPGGTAVALAEGQTRRQPVRAGLKAHPYDGKTIRSLRNRGT